MNNYSISLSDNKALMLKKQQTLAAVELGSITKLFVVHFASPLFHGDEPFYVLVFDKSIWVMPNDVNGIRELLIRIQTPLEANNGLYRAQAENCPLVWRHRVFGFLPLFPMPRLAQHAMDTMPNWKELGPLRKDELPELP